MSNSLRILQRVIYGLLVCLSLVAASELAEAQDRPSVVTTTGMLADVVSNLAGEFVEVKGLMGSGVDPHLYKPTRTDIATLFRSDLAIYNGLLLEGKMTDAFARLEGAERMVIAAGEEIPSSFLYHPPGFEGHPDPHLWMDPLSWKEVVKVVAASLRTLLAEQQATITENEMAYLAELEALHQYTQSALETIPAERRILVTAHDAFHYFGERYKMRVIGIQGISTESEAGLHDLEKIVSLLVEKQINSVFVETTVPDRTVKALIEGAAAQDHVVTIGGELFSDAMGKEGTAEGTYIGMIRHNVNTITNALQ